MCSALGLSLVQTDNPPQFSGAEGMRGRSSRPFSDIQKLRGQPGIQEGGREGGVERGKRGEEIEGERRTSKWEREKEGWGGRK